MTFFVEKDCVDIIFKIRKGVCLTVQVYSLSEGRLLLACRWSEFWNRLKGMRNRQGVLAELQKSCPLAANIFANTFGKLSLDQAAPHFVYLDIKQTQRTVVLIVNAHIQTDSITNYLHEEVVKRAMEQMVYNLNLQVKLEGKCTFPQWKKDLKIVCKTN